MRNGHFTAVVGYGNKGDDLVVRTFDIELNLRMLVGNSERFNGRCACVDFVAVVVLRLSYRFCPKLAIPIRHKLQIVRIRH